jgi:hypothetical protein
MGDGTTAAFVVPFANLDVSKRFRRTIVLAADPHVVKAVLNGKAADFPKAARYQRLRFAFGDGLLTAPIPIWKASREVLPVLASGRPAARYYLY